MSFILIAAIIAGIALWVAAGALNYRLYGMQFGHECAFTDRDLLVLLGPIGTVMLSLTAAIAGVLSFSRKGAALVSNWPTIGLIGLSIALPYFGSAIANRIWYRRQFADGPEAGDADLLVLLGPIGSFMLLMTAVMGFFLSLCQKLGSARV